MIPFKDDNPSTITPYVTFVLIGCCALVFIGQLLLGGRGNQAAIIAFGLVPVELLSDALPYPGIPAVPDVLTVFTSMFMHGGIMHFAGNMLYLWIFSDNIEDSMGHGRFILFYFLCGVGAALAQAIPEPGSAIPMIGASGAISGVLGAYLLLFPHARVHVGIPFGFYLHVTRFPAGVVLGVWFALQLFSELTTAPGSAGVAFRAHIGGFVVGAALIPFFRKPQFPLLGRRGR
ncbi:MAG: rhomboid family intramembrane serine protease [Gammaproteobacteria bacterium]|nr:rhomboid family intramembrane serine protease [Gammaproteobacteria bacterium]